MATKKQDEPAIEPDRYYIVTLARVADFGGRKLPPVRDYRMKGKAVTALGDAVKSAVPEKAKR